MSTLLKDKLRELRSNINYTQKQVADYLNMTRQGYAHYEAGLRNPDYQTLLKLPKLYNIDIGELINISTTPINTNTFHETTIYNLKQFQFQSKVSNKLIQLSVDEKKLLHLYHKLSMSEKREVLQILEQKVNSKNL